MVYTFDHEKALSEEFKGYDHEKAYHAVNEKYGSLQDSPYGKESVMASVDSVSSYWTMLFDLERTDDAVSVEQAVREETKVGDPSMEMNGGTFMSLFNHGIILRPLCETVDKALENADSEEKMMMKLGLVIEGIKKMKGVELEEQLVDLIRDVSGGINENAVPLTLQ